MRNSIYTYHSPVVATVISLCALTLTTSSKPVFADNTQQYNLSSTASLESTQSTVITTVHQPLLLDKDIQLTEETLGKRNIDNSHKNIISYKDETSSYTKLQTARDKYLHLSNSQHWHAISSGPSLTFGDTHQQVKELKSQLSLLGDLRFPTKKTSPTRNQRHEVFEKHQEDSIFFDRNLEQALIRFQKRNGLEVTGKLDPITRKTINTPPAVVANKISHNLNRWQQLPEQFGERYVLVNLPNYQLQFVADGEIKLSMKVIIGRKLRPTPMMVDKITSIVFNPSWNVPPKIAKLDLLPAIKRDPNFLHHKKFNVYSDWKATEPLDSTTINWEAIDPEEFTYRLRQSPGDQNALGRIKFYLANDRAIYLHDTNHKELFLKNKRSLSSGCIRIENPLELANQILQLEPNTMDETPEEQLSTAETKAIPLHAPIPIYLMYWTAWIDENNQLQIRDDIYGNDKLDSAKLKNPLPPMNGHI